MIRIIKIGDTIYEKIEPFYFDENGNQIWNISNNMDEFKTALIDTVKWQAGQKLKETDWTVVKCTELGVSIAEKYPDIATQRQAIRDWSNQKEAEINDCLTIDELLAIDIVLPKEV